MTDEPPLPPTVIVPYGRCWEWYGRRPHEPHLMGNPPDTRLCEGYEPPDLKNLTADS